MSRDEGDAAADGAVTDRMRLIISQLEDADFERFDPPEGLWERIESSITSGATRPPREPPSRESAAGMVVEYCIDANDVVVDVGQSWTEFASDNDAPELAVLPSGRVLWTYFDSDEVRDLWRLVVERVRRSERGAEVPLRCDAPDARRWFEMTITPEANGRVRFRCALVFEEARPRVLLLDPRSERDVQLQSVPLCGWCGRGQHGSRWLDVEELVRVARLLESMSIPPISYGICASCRDEMSAELLVPGEVGGSSA